MYITGKEMITADDIQIAHVRHAARIGQHGDKSLDYDFVRAGMISELALALADDEEYNLTDEDVVRVVNNYIDVIDKCTRKYIEDRQTCPEYKYNAGPYGGWFREYILVEKSRWGTNPPR
jgi:hypothetical protein